MFLVGRMIVHTRKVVMARTKNANDELTPEIRRKIKRLHRPMDRRDAAGGVIPMPEIVNRRTGYVQKFGPRRAFDGSYVGEVLAASGCLTEDVENALWVLSPLAEHNCGDWTVQELLDVLPVVFYEQLTEEHWNKLRKAGHGARSQLINSELTITAGKPPLTVIK
jgi:hypothetical protein